MRIIIVGCGRLGSGLAQTLSQSGHSITVIDSDPDSFERLPSSFKGNKIIGIGFDRDVLIEAGIERVDGLAAVTTSDEANAVIARIARNVFRVPKVVARLYDQHKAEIYKRLDIQTIDTSGWGINRAADMLLYSPFDIVLDLGGGVDIITIEVPALLVGRTVKDLTITGEIQVVAINRGNKAYIPTLGTEFQKRDILHLAVTVKSGERLKSLLGFL